MRGSKRERLVDRCHEIRRLFHGVDAGKHETGLAMFDRVLESADAVHDTRHTVSHGEHLADTARLEARGHQEQVRRSVQVVRERFRIAAKKYEIRHLACNVEYAPLAVGLAAAE